MSTAPFNLMGWKPMLRYGVLVSEGVYPDGTPHPPARLRMRVAIELGIIAILTGIFLYVTSVYKIRDSVLYVGMALIGLVLVALTAQETRERIWGPPTSPSFDRIRRCTVSMTLLTIPPVLLFLILGGLGRYFDWLWLADAHRPAPMVNERFFLVMLFYLPWALLQQTLFQFYLLGRLRVLLPFASPLLLSVLNGIAYGLVHLPDLPVTAVTIIGGIFWSYSYHRDRYVLPIAASHALLAPTFYYWICGKDLAAEFSAKYLTK